MKVNYWNEAVETCPRSELERLQLVSLRETLSWALKTPFYRERLSQVGMISPRDLRTVSDLEHIPYTTKDDLRSAFPDGMLAVSKDDVIRLHTSSGTTGTPTVIYHTQHDIDGWTELVARCFVAAGATKSDVLQNMTTYGLFTGGLGMHYGGERMGMMVIPMSSGNTSRQLKYMRDFKTTIVHATPSYMLHVYSVLQKEGVSHHDLCLKKGFLGAEPYSEETRRKIEALYQIDVYNSYGLSEMNGPGVAFECVYKCGMHLWEDAYYLEVLNTQTMRACPEGETGELVLTTLLRQGTPILRYRTRDLTSVIPGSCPCGRTHRRIARLTGRNDDMLLINGVNVFPSQIEEVIMRFPEVGTNYVIVVDKKDSLDKLTVKTEINSSTFTGDIRGLDSLKGRIVEALRSTITIHPIIELHEPGSLPVSEGKAKRVIDNRPLF